MREMKSNHELEECKQCAWNKGRSFTACEVFLDKRNVILDEYGRCNALAKECPSCHSVNRIMVGSDLGVYQFIDEDKTKELKEKRKND